MMDERPRNSWCWRVASMFLVPAIVGCAGPEDGRSVGGGPGGDGGNYRGKPIHVPSKLDGTRTIPRLAPAAVGAAVGAGYSQKQG